MCSLRLSTEDTIAWEAAAHRYDHKHDIAIWEGNDPRKCVRYYTLTAQCGLFSWDWFTGKWVMDKELPVHVHDPVAIKHLAERMLA